jgi:hypothetical protein
MSKSLLTLGVLILAFAVFGNIGHHVLPAVTVLDFFDDFQNTVYLAMAGGAAIVLSVLVKILSPAKKVLSRNKCRQCGTAIPPGDLYCLSCVKQLQGRRR